MHHGARVVPILSTRGAKSQHLGQLQMAVTFLFIDRFTSCFFLLGFIFKMLSIFIVKIDTRCLLVSKNLHQKYPKKVLSQNFCSGNCLKCALHLISKFLIVFTEIGGLVLFDKSSLLKSACGLFSKCCNFFIN